jgi:hypothetical protein
MYVKLSLSLLGTSVQADQDKTELKLLKMY